MARKNLRGRKQGGGLKGIVKGIQLQVHKENRKKARRARALAAEAKSAAKIDSSETSEYRNLFKVSGGLVLLVGEGNLSFARSLCEHLGKGDTVFATNLDSETTIKRKYADAEENQKFIEETGGTVLYGVDACRIHCIKEFRRTFRTIVWNFPHTGSGQTDVEKNTAEHRELLSKFFASSKRCLTKEKNASIHVSLKEGEPYKSWKIVKVARAACNIDLKTVARFMPSEWPGYEHRRTIGFLEHFSNADNVELEKGAKTYVFVKGKGEGDSDDE